MIVTISPGAIGPDAPLAPFVTEVTRIAGVAAALTVSWTEMVCGLFVAPEAVSVIVPL